MACRSYGANDEERTGFNEGDRNMTIGDLLAKHGLSVDMELPAPQYRTITIDDRKNGKMFNVETRIVTCLADILGLAADDLGKAPEERAEDSTRENWGSGTIRHINIGLNLTARTEGRQAKTLTPARMRDHAQLWGLQHGTEEIKASIMKGLMDKSLKTVLDKIWTDHESEIRTAQKIED
jgi:hypothetical protein